jgi:hypothetical protein
MNPHNYYTSDHDTLRKQAAALREIVEKKPADLSPALDAFQVAVQKHFKHEDPYYRILDDGKRIEDRGLIHQLRNDHAAVIFTLESLRIRLKKNGVNSDWKTRFETLMSVFLPHLDQEDNHLFPIGKKLLTPQEIEMIAERIQNDD